MGRLPPRRPGDPARLGTCGGDLGGVTPVAGASANIRRWIDNDGVSVGFVGPLASA